MTKKEMENIKICIDVNKPLDIKHINEDDLKRSYFNRSLKIITLDEKAYLKLVDILNKLFKDNQITEEGHNFLFDNKLLDGEIYKKYYLIEAKRALNKYKKTKDIWSLINASSHFRKAKQASEIYSYLEKIDIESLPSNKIKSAFCTTFGGVKRDLEYYRAGLPFAEKAHKAMPKDYRPCTLMGALYYELGALYNSHIDYDKGNTWFELAKKLGAPLDSRFDELCKVYLKANKERRAELETIAKEKFGDEFYNWILSYKEKEKVKEKQKNKKTKKTKK